MKRFHIHVGVADLAAREDGVTNCCYARSDKYWITDPQGVAWETFHTLNDIPTFAGHPAGSTAAASPACCAPDASKQLSAIPVKAAASACC